MKKWTNPEMIVLGIEETANGRFESYIEFENIAHLPAPATPEPEENLS